MSQDASNLNDTLEIGSEEEVPSNPISNWNVELILPVNKQNISNDDLEKEQADENNNAQSKNWNCECGKNYTCLASLKRHKKRHTSKEKKCEICSKIFYTDYEFKRHYSIHTEKEFQCDICLKKFKSESGLRHHKSIHTGEYKHLCPTCGRGFNNVEGFHAHISSHDQIRRYECDRCKKGFTCKSNLKRHSCGKQIGKHSCDVCGKAFKQIRYLKDHMSGHDNPERFICVTCGNAYKYRSSLYKHCKMSGHQ